MAPFVLVVLGTMAVGFVALLYPVFVSPTERDVAWIAGADVVPGDEAAVYHRYLDRHRRHRLTGGIFGGALAVVVGIRFYGNIQLIGAGEQTSPLGDVFFCVLAGVVVGELLAETYRLGEERERPRAASLAPRGSIELPRVVRGARVLGAVTLVWGLGVGVLAGHWGPLGVAILGGVIALVAEATRHAVTNRRRPATSTRALHVDSRIRAFAGRSVSWLELAVATLTATWVLSLTPVPAALDEGARTGVEGVQVVLVLAGLVASVVLLRRATPRPPRHVAAAQIVEPA